MASEEAKRIVEQADRLCEKMKFKEAVEAYDRALATDPANVDAWISRGIALDEMGLTREALHSWDKALSIDPKAASAWYMRAGELEVLGRFQDAVESYEKALELDGISFPYGDQEIRRILNQLQEWLESRRGPIASYRELYDLVMPTEIKLRLFIRQVLEKELGKGELEWWVKGVPETIRLECGQRREKDRRRRDYLEYTYFIDLKTIMDKKWALFEPSLQRISGQFESKKEFLDALDRLNDLRNLVAHPKVTDPPSREDLEFARHMMRIIDQFTDRG